MKILILGADGMLGHQLAASLGSHHEIVGTVRMPASAYDEIRSELPSHLYGEIDASNFGRVREVLRAERPDAVVNAVGIVKQRAESADAICSIEINSLLPHRLAVECVGIGARLVHVSTDCVFSGSKGSYAETDFADARDLYGRSKLLGEIVASPNAITLRTSIIGLEISRKNSLVEWFLAQRKPIRGYRRAIYSGFTTLEFARVVEMLLTRPDWDSGLYHASSDPIDKFTLLSTLRDELGLPLEISPDDKFVCERGLNSDRFRQRFGYAPPSWAEMLRELASQIRERHRDS